MRVLLLLALAAPTAFAQAFRAGGDLDEALRRAHDDARPLIAYVSMPGCLACMRMDRTTLADPDLAPWIDARAETLRIDAAADPDSAARLGVRAFPTLVRIDPGGTTSRLLGFHTADQVRGWIEHPAPPTASDANASLERLHDHAMNLVMAGDDPRAAATALAEVWVRASVEPDTPPTLRWLCRERYPGLLATLAKDPAARDAIAPLAEGFDADGPEPDAPAGAIDAYLAIMPILGRSDALDAWLDRMLLADAGVRALRGSPRAFDRLADAGRWHDAGRVANPVDWERWLHRLRNEPVGNTIDDSAPPNAMEHERLKARARLERFRRALRAASRDAEADALDAAIGTP
ncbi:MAG: thioredoxin family protein [Phycisphaerales bacterium]|jgi:hypothetical protein|nr:thioredoxin family protein [Phycisphaerales bacterium]